MKQNKSLDGINSHPDFLSDDNWLDPGKHYINIFELCRGGIIMASELSLVKTLLRLVPETNIVPGQYIACTDSTRAFYDISDGVRIEVNF